MSLDKGMTLRDFGLDDVALLATLAEDQDVAYYDGDRVPGGWSGEEERKLVLVPELIGDDSSLPLGIVVCRQVSSQLVVYSVGVDLVADCRGLGLGKLVMRQVLQKLFGELAADRVELLVRDYNARAIRCYEAVGFRHEGMRRQCGRIANHTYSELLMGILRDEYFISARFGRQE